MELEFENGAIIYTDDCSIYEVYSIEIDKEEKTIDCYDQNGFPIAQIIYDESEEIGYIGYNNKGVISPYPNIISKNGELVF